MALKVIDGFDHISTHTAKGWSANMTQITGRIAGNGARLAGIVAQDNPSKKSIAGGSFTELYFGFAWRCNAFSSLSVSGNIANLQTAANSRAVVLSVSTTGKVSCGGVTGTASLVQSTWHYIEVYVLINGASSKVQTWIDGVEDIPLTTVNHGSTAVTQFEFRNNTNSTSTNFDYDDLYILDTTGGVNDSQLGDVHVETIMPDGDGNYTEWQLSTGASHSALVDDPNNFDSDTTYVKESTVNDRDTYTYADLVPANATIFGVQVNNVAKKDDATLRQVASMARLNGSDYVGATHTLTTSYVDYQHIWDQSPDTAADWTVTEINAAEFGVKVIT